MDEILLKLISDTADLFLDAFSSYFPVFFVVATI